MPRKQSIEDVKKRIQEIHNNEVKIVDSTFLGMHVKAKFIDRDFGEWWATPGNVCNNRSGHPERGKIKKGKKKRLTIDEVKRRLFEVHGDVVKLIDSTYVSADKKATFIDKDYGEWSAQVKSVLHGRRHTQHRNELAKTNRLMTHDQFVQKLKEVHGDKVKICDTYVNSHKKMKFFDQKYGHWKAMPYSVLAGHSHPLRGQSIRAKKMRHSTTIQHWKSGELLTCVGSYEAAFVNWCNDNQIDFDWQIPFDSIDEKTYIVDALIKTGEFKDTYIEIKGHWMQEISKVKWEHFHDQHPNSQLWDVDKLKTLKIIL